MKLDVKNMKIAVLYGGPSSEREVSLKSGSAVIKALKTLKVKKVIPIIVNRDTRWITKLSSTKPDFVFIALHGKYGEDGTVQSILEFLNLPYTGSKSGSSYLAMNKIYSKKIFRLENIPTPEGFVITKTTNSQTKAKISESYRKAIKLPGEKLIVKPSDEGSAVGVSLVGKSLKEFTRAIQLAWRYSHHAIVEKYIPGTEITVGILDDKPLAPIEIIPKNKFYDYTSKYGNNMSSHLIPPVHINNSTAKRCQQIALKAFHALGCQAFARIDLRVNPQGKIFVLEVNTLPGLTPTSLLPDAARYEGMSFESLITKMITSSLSSE